MTGCTTPQGSNPLTDNNSNYIGQYGTVERSPQNSADSEIAHRSQMCY